MTFIDAVIGKGCVQVDDVISALRPTTCLVTIMLANNETGIIQVQYLLMPCMGPDCCRVGQFHFLAGWHKRDLNQAFVLLGLV